MPEDFNMSDFTANPVRHTENSTPKPFTPPVSLEGYADQVAREYRAVNNPLGLQTEFTDQERLEAPQGFYRGQELNIGKYLNTSLFDKLGYSLIGDNENKYYEAQPWYKQAANALVQFGGQASQAFASQLNKVEQIKETFGNSSEGYLEDEFAFSERLREQFPTFKSNQELSGLAGYLVPGKAFSKWSNFVPNLGFTVGAMMGVALENLIATAIIEAATLGAGTPIAIAKIAKSSYDAYNKISKFHKLSKLANFAQKGSKAIVDYTKIFGSAGNVIRGAEAFSQGRNLTGLLHSAYGSYQLYSNAAGEALIENSHVIGESMGLMTEDFKKTNGRDPNEEETKEMREIAEDAILPNTLGNIAVLMASNSLQQFNAFKIGKAIGSIGGSANLVTKEILKKSVLDRTTGKFRAMVGTELTKEYVKGIARGSFEILAEGLEESAQGVLSTATIQMVFDRYQGIDSSFYDNLGAGFAYAGSEEGMEEFWAGIVTGAIFRGGGRSRNSYKKFIEKRNLADKGVTPESYQDRVLEELNDGVSYLERYYFATSDSAAEVNSQTILEGKIREAADRGDENTADIYRKMSMAKAVVTATAYGKGNVLLDKFKDLSDLSDQDLAKYLDVSVEEVADKEFRANFVGDLSQALKLAEKVFKSRPNPYRKFNPLDPKFIIENSAENLSDNSGTKISTNERAFIEANGYFEAWQTAQEILIVQKLMAPALVKEGNKLRSIINNSNTSIEEIAAVMQSSRPKKGQENDRETDPKYKELADTHIERLKEQIKTEEGILKDAKAETTPRKDYIDNIKQEINTLSKRLDIIQDTNKTASQKVRELNRKSSQLRGSFPIIPLNLGTLTSADEIIYAFESMGRNSADFLYTANVIDALDSQEGFEEFVKGNYPYIRAVREGLFLKLKNKNKEKEDIDESEFEDAVEVEVEDITEEQRTQLQEELKQLEEDASKLKEEQSELIKEKKDLESKETKTELAKINEVKPTSVKYYLSTPNSDGSFNESSAKNSFTVGASMFSFQDIGNNKYEVYVNNNESSIKLALQYPDKNIDPIFNAISAYNPKAKTLQTIKPAIVQLNNGKFNLISKGEIDYDNIGIEAQRDALNSQSQKKGTENITTDDVAAPASEVETKSDLEIEKIKTQVNNAVSDVYSAAENGRGHNPRNKVRTHSDPRGISGQLGLRPALGEGKSVVTIVEKLAVDKNQKVLIYAIETLVDNRGGINGIMINIPKDLNISEKVMAAAKERLDTYFEKAFKVKTVKNQEYTKEGFAMFQNGDEVFKQILIEELSKLESTTPIPTSITQNTPEQVKNKSASVSEIEAKKAEIEKVTTEVEEVISKELPEELPQPADKIVEELGQDPKKAIESLVETEVVEEVAEIVAEEEDKTVEEVKEEIVEEVEKQVTTGKVNNKLGSKIKAAVKKIINIIKKAFLMFFVMTTIAGGTIVAAKQGVNVNPIIEASLQILPHDAAESAIRLLAKKGIYDPTVGEEVIKIKQETKEVDLKVKSDSVYAKNNTFTEVVKIVKDSHYKARKGKNDSFIMIRNQFMNSKGFNYVTSPIKSKIDKYHKTYNVQGVAHFMILDDQAVDLSNKTSKDELQKASDLFRKNRIGKDIKADDYVPVFKKLGNNVINTSYKKAKDLDSSDLIITKLNQVIYGDIDFKSKFRDDKQFGEGIYSLTTYSGDMIQSLLFTDKGKDAYSRFSGGSVVFIFTDSKGNEIVRDFSGSINMIKKEGDDIARVYNIDKNSITIGFYDAGSYTGKPAANAKGEIEYNQYKGFNITQPNSGGALMIPQQESETPMTPVQAGIFGLFLFGAGKRKQSQESDEDTVTPTEPETPSKREVEITQEEEGTKKRIKEIDLTLKDISSKLKEIDTRISEIKKQLTIPKAKGKIEPEEDVEEEFQKEITPRQQELLDLLSTKPKEGNIQLTAIDETIEIPIRRLNLSIVDPTRLLLNLDNYNQGDGTSIPSSFNVRDIDDFAIVTNTVPEEDYDDDDDKNLQPTVESNYSGETYTIESDERRSKSFFRTIASEDASKVTGKANQEEIDRRIAVKNKINKGEITTVKTLVLVKNSSDYTQVDEYQSQIEEGKIKKEPAIVGILADASGNPISFDKLGNIIENGDKSTYMIENMVSSNNKNMETLIEKSPILNEDEKIIKRRQQLAVKNLAEKLRSGESTHVVANIEEVSPGAPVFTNNLTPSSNRVGEITDYIVVKTGKRHANFILNSGRKETIFMNSPSKEQIDLALALLLDPTLQKGNDAAEYLRAVLYLKIETGYQVVQHKLTKIISIKHRNQQGSLKATDPEDAKTIRSLLSTQLGKINVDIRSGIDTIPIYELQDGKVVEVGEEDYLQFLISNSQMDKGPEDNTKNIFFTFSQFDRELTHKELLLEESTKQKEEDEDDYIPASAEGHTDDYLIRAFALDTKNKEEENLPTSAEGKSEEDLLEAFFPSEKVEEKKEEEVTKEEDEQTGSAEGLSDESLISFLNGEDIEKTPKSKVEPKTKPKTKDKKDNNDDEIDFPSFFLTREEEAGSNIAFTDQDFEQAEELVKLRFKDFPEIQKNYKFIRRIVNSNIWGTWSPTLTQIFGNDPLGTSDHESWHNFSQFLLTKEQKVKLYEDAIKNVEDLKQYSNLPIKERHLKAEEWIAEDFRKYVKSNATNTIKGFVTRNVIFRALYKLVQQIKKAFGITNDFKIGLDTMYRELSTGDLSKYKFSVDNIYFTGTTLKREVSDELHTLEVSKLNVNEALREINNFFDFNASKTTVRLSKDSTGISSISELNSVSKIELLSAMSDDARDNILSRLNQFSQALKSPKATERHKQRLRETMAFLSHVNNNLLSYFDKYLKEKGIIKDNFEIVGEIVEGEEKAYIMEGNVKVPLNEDERTSKGIETTLSGNELSVKEKSSEMTKFLMQGIPSLTKVGDTFTTTTNKYGFTPIVGENLMWNNIANKTANIYHQDEFFNRLLEVSKILPETIILLSQIPFTNQNFIDKINRTINDILEPRLASRYQVSQFNPETESDTLKGLMVRGGFFQDFRNYRIPEKVMIYNEQEGVKYNPRYYSASSNSLKNFKQDTQRNLIKLLKQGHPDISPYYNGNTLSIPEFAKLIEDARESMDDKEVVKGIFKILGIDLNDSVFASPEYSTENVNNILKFFTTANYFNENVPEADLIKIKEPVFDIGRTYKSKNNKKVITLGVKGYLDLLLNANIQVTPEYVSNTVINAKGELQNELSYYTYTMMFVSELNNSKRYIDLNSFLENSGFFFMNPETNKAAKASSYMNSIFNLDAKPGSAAYGVRRTVSKSDLTYVTVEMENLNGLDTRGVVKNSAIVSQKTVPELTTDEKTILYDIPALINNGIKENIRAADKNRSFAFKVTLASNSKFLVGKMKQNTEEYFENSKNNNVFKLFKKYLNYELDRIKEEIDTPSGVDIYQDRATDFIIMKDILNMSYEDYIDKFDKKSVKELDDFLSKRLEEFFNNRTTKFIKETFTDTSNTIDVVRNLVDDVKFEDGKFATSKNLIDFYVLEDFLRNVEEMLFLYQDPAYYSNFIKRAPAYSSNGVIPLLSDDLTDFFTVNDSYYKKFTKDNGKAGKVPIYDKKALAVILEDIPVGMQEDVRKAFESYMSEEKAAVFNKTYTQGTADLTDAQALTTLDFYRVLSISMRVWSDKQEQFYRKLADKAFISMNDIAFFPPLKYGYTGPITKNGKTHVTYHKYSIAPIIPGAYEKGTHMEELEQTMYDQNIDIITFHSAAKFGATNISKSFVDNKINTSMESSTIYVDFFKQQLKIEARQKQNGILGSQFQKGLFRDTFSNKVPIDYTKSKNSWNKLNNTEKRNASRIYDLYSRFTTALSNLTDIKKARLLTSGIEVTKDAVNIVDWDKFIDFIYNRLELKGVNEDVKEFVINSKGKSNFRSILESSKNKHFVDAILTSIINNDIISQKVNGEALIQHSEFAMSSIEIDRIKSKLDSYTIVQGEDGKARVRAIDVAVSFNIKNYLPLLNLKHNGETLKVYKEINGKRKLDIKASINKLNQAINDPIWRESNSKALRIISYRIPTQGLESIDILNIREFLQPETGNVIIVPGNLVAKTGSDFDIDKMNIVRPEFLLTKSDIKNIVQSEVIQKKNFIRQYKNSMLLKEELTIESLTAILEKDNPDGLIEFTLRSAWEEFYEDENINQDKIFSIPETPVNEIIAVTFDLLSDTSMIDKMHAPLENFILERIAKKLGLSSINLIKVNTDLFTKSYINFIRSTMVEGGKELGIGAVASSMNQLIKLSDISLNENYADNTGTFKKTMILFDTKKDRQGRTIISMETTMEGTSKSDILTQMVSVFVDISNDPLGSTLGFNTHNTPVVTYSTFLGISEYNTFSLINKPIVQKYSRLIQGNLTDIFKTKFKKTYQKDFTLIKNLISSELNLDDKDQEDFNVFISRRMFSIDPVTTKPYITSKSSLKYQLNGALQDIQRDRPDLIEKFKKNSKDPISNVIGLLQYIELKEQADNFRNEFQGNMNHDTARLKSLFQGIMLSHNKSEMIRTQRSIVPIVNFVEVGNRSTIKSLDMRPNMLSVFQKMYPFLKQKYILDMTIDIMEELNVIPVKYDTVSRTILNDTILHAIHTSTMSEEALPLIDTRSPKNIKRLFEDTELALADYNMESPELSLFKNIQITESVDSSFIKIFFNERNVDTETEDNYKNLWMNYDSKNIRLPLLDESNPKTEEEREVDLEILKNFFDKLAVAKIFSYGLNLYPNSFWSLIPNQKFEGILEPILKKAMKSTTIKEDYSLNFFELFKLNNTKLDRFTADDKSIREGGYFKNYTNPLHSFKKEDSLSQSKEGVVISKQKTDQLDLFNSLPVIPEPTKEDNEKKCP